MSPATRAPPAWSCRWGRGRAGSGVGWSMMGGGWRRRGSSERAGPGGKVMREAPPTRVLVADDHAVVRRGLALLLNREPDFEVVAEAADGAEAVEKALAGEVGLVILDVAMPRMSGLQAARELARRR